MYEVTVATDALDVKPKPAPVHFQRSVQRRFHFRGFLLFLFHV